MKFWPVADVILLFTEYPYRRPPWYVLLLMGTVGITFLWSTDPLAPLFFTLRIYLLWSVVKHSVRTRIYQVAALGMGVNILGIFTGWEYDWRWSFQYENPELVGLAGMGVFVSYWPFAWIGGLAAGLAGSRAALLYMIGVSALTRNRYLIYATIASSLVLVLVRFILPGETVAEVIETTVDQRTATIEKPRGDYSGPDLIGTLDADRGIIEPTDHRILKLPEYPIGLGYHAFNDRVGQTPHILPVLVIREMGGLGAAVVFYLAINGAFRYRRQWKLIVPLIPYFMFTDSVWYFPSGHYFAALFALTLYKCPITQQEKRRKMYQAHRYQ